MRVLPVCFAASLSLVLVIPVVAQQAGTTSTQSQPQRDPQAVSLLQKSFLAMGGTGLGSITSIRMQGETTREMGTKQVTATLTFKCSGLNTCRLDLASDSYSYSSIVNKDQGIESDDGVSLRMPMHNLINHPLKYFPLFTELSAWADSGYSVTYVAEESLNGSQVHHIHTERYFPGLDSRMSALYSRVSGTELYLDSTTLYLVKRSQQLPFYEDMGRSLLLEQSFSAYQVQNGFCVPFQISTYLAGRKFSDTQIESVHFNSGVSESDFTVQ